MNCNRDGHNWQHTTSDLVQQCATCHKKRQKMNSQWYLVTAQKSGIKPKQAIPGQGRLL